MEKSAVRRTGGGAEGEVRYESDGLFFRFVELVPKPSAQTHCPRDLAGGQGGGGCGRSQPQGRLHPEGHGDGRRETGQGAIEYPANRHVGSPPNLRYMNVVPAVKSKVRTICMTCGTQPQPLWT